MVFNEFITDKDKPYSENLNDALCLVDAFDLTVPLNMPAGFSNGEFSSNIGITRKCGVGLVTLMSRDSGVTIGTDSISGSGELVFRIYPNFNSFYKWSKILLTKTGNVTIGFRRVDGTDISVTVDSDGNISDNTDLRELKEIDLVLTLSSATISQVLVWFVNDQTVGRVRSSALLEASQLANVNGQVVAGEVKAVNGGTVKTALDSLHSTVTSEIEDLEDSITGETNAKLVLKEDKSNKVTVLDSNSSHYPSCTAVNAGLNLKEDKSNKVTTLDSNSSHYPSCTAVNTGLASKEDKSNKVTIFDGNSSHYPNNQAMEYLLIIIRDIVNVNIVPDFHYDSSRIYLKGQITYSFLSKAFIEMYYVNKSTGESKMAWAERAPASSGTFSEELKVNPDNYNYYFKVIAPNNTPYVPVLFVSPVYDKNNNIVG